ncbi:MAG: hypothetical protein QM688_11525, partial [Sphingomonas bacterium]
MDRDTRLQWWVLTVAAIVLGAAVLHATVPGRDAIGINPRPIRLVRPPQQPLSALATVGQRIFHDASLSASGRQSCA